MERPTKIALIAALLALFAFGPDALAQKRGGRRGGRNPFASNGLFGAKGKKGARNAPPALPDKPRASSLPDLPAPVARAPLAADERRFRELLDKIDDAIAKADRQRAEARDHVERLGFELPEGVEPGTVEWRNLQKPIFETADYDRSGWISFREARESLEIDRGEFALYDRDRDGRIGAREFIARYDEVVAAAGAFRLPKPRSDERELETRTPEQLRSAFDADGDGALGSPELAKVIERYGRREVAPEVLMEMLDLDRSGGLNGTELFQLTRVISVSLAGPAGDEIKRGKSKTIADLFGAVVARPRESGSASAPPWIPGPVPHFRRLDLDGNGYVGIDELRELQGSTALATRIGAVLATLDLDEDGRITEREFLTALSTARK
jgi:Ca2+-binding EF-hand superfamily protein